MSTDPTPEPRADVEALREMAYDISSDDFAGARNLRAAAAELERLRARVLEQECELDELRVPAPTETKERKETWQISRSDLRSAVILDDAEVPVCYLYPPDGLGRDRIGLLGNDDETYAAAQWLADRLNQTPEVRE